MAIVFAMNDLIAGAPWTSLSLYRVFMIIVMIVLLPHVILWRHQDPVESAVRMIGTLVLCLSILHDNLVSFDLFPWRVSLASYGMGLFVLGLGFVTARVFFADQREFAAVERELETARLIQTSILPRSVPCVTGLDVAVRYVPARQVAGDVYDFLRIDVRRLSVLVADVAGHGVPAALIASMATVAFSSHPELADEPGEILGEMNRVFCGHFDARFVTAACFFSTPGAGCSGTAWRDTPGPCSGRSGCGGSRNSPKAASCSVSFGTRPIQRARCPSRPAIGSSSTRTDSPKRATRPENGSAIAN